MPDAQISILLLGRAFLVIVVLLGAHEARADEAKTPCAFEFQVNSPSGVPLEGLAVALNSESGAEQKATTDPKGVVRFCDAPLEFHQLTVGGPWCGQLRVGFLTPGLPETVRMTLTYKNCHGFMALGSCSFVLRFKWADATVAKDLDVDLGNGKSVYKVDRTDEYGRLFVNLAYNSRILLSPHLPVSESDPAWIACEPGKGERIERTITLPRAP